MISFCDSYIEDIKNNRLTKCKILFPFFGFSEFSEIKKSEQSFQLHAYKLGNEIRTIIDREIPDTLIENLKTGKASSIDFLLGYINEAFKIINENILRKKYSSAQILNRPLTIQDIKWISIANLKNNEKFLVPWPIPFPDFPYEVDLKKYDYTYVRDLLDAMTSYVNFDFNEVLRKVITSLENALTHYKIKKLLKRKLIEKNKIAPKDIKINFLDQIRAVVVRAELVYNLEILYKIRNKIVHDKLRLSHDNDTLCHKSIITLLYVYKGYLSESQEMSDYMLKVEFQFNFIIQMYRGMKIENFIIKDEKNVKTFSGPGPEFDDFMFKPLQIKDTEIPDLLTKNKKDA